MSMNIIEMMAFVDFSVESEELNDFIAANGEYVGNRGYTLVNDAIFADNIEIADLCRDTAEKVVIDRLYMDIGHVVKMEIKRLPKEVIDALIEFERFDRAWNMWKDKEVFHAEEDDLSDEEWEVLYDAEPEWIPDIV